MDKLTPSLRLAILRSIKATDKFKAHPHNSEYRAEVIKANEQLKKEFNTKPEANKLFNDKA